MVDNILKKQIEPFINIDINKKSYQFALSGRTSIDFAIKDIKNKNNIEKALLPTYICESMILPFIINNVPIEFYEVKYHNEKFKIDFEKIKNNDNAIVLLCDYFVPDKDNYQLLASILNKKQFLIHDITHTLFSNEIITENDDYVVCSLRKWFNIPDGGIIIGNDPFSINYTKENETYIKNKITSKQMRSIYSKNPTKENKIKYKYYYNIADKILDEDFSEYSISTYSTNTLLNTDIKQMLINRKQLLIEIRQILSETNLILHEGQNCDNLFTIPIIVPNNRDLMLEKLYFNGIRCAIFWEYNKYNNKYNNYFVNNSICLDISENTKNKLKKILVK